MQDVSWVVKEEFWWESRVIIIVESDNPTFHSTLARWPGTGPQMKVEIISCRENHILRGQEEWCQLAALVREARETIKAWGGKLVLVWDSTRSPPIDGLEALVEESSGQ